MLTRNQAALDSLLEIDGWHFELIILPCTPEYSIYMYVVYHQLWGFVLVIIMKLQVDQFFFAADADGDARISFEEFERVLMDTKK